MEKTKSHKKINKGLVIKIIFLLYIFVICSTWAINMKYNDTMGPPDERMKYDVCNFIFKYKALPHGGDEQIRDGIWGLSYGFTPILSYMFSAVFMIITSAFTSDSSIIFIASRFVSVICMVAYAFVNILISKKMFKDKIYRYLYVALVTLLPQVIFLGSYLNNDSLALLSISVIIYSWLNGIEKSWNYKSCIIMGLGIGICALSYYNAYGYILLSVIIYFASNIIKKISIKDFLKKGLVISAISLLIAGWWFVRSYNLYNGDFLGLETSREYGEKYAQEQYKPSNRATPFKNNMPLNQMLFEKKWITTTIDSFIGVYGHMSIRMHDWIYVLYKMIYVFAILGILIKLIKWLIKKIRIKKDNDTEKKIDMHNKEKLLFNIIMFFGILIPIILSIYYSYFSDFQPQGRYIMPIIIPFTYFIVKGIKYIFECLIKKRMVKNIIVISIIVIWTIMPIYIFFNYIQ